MAQAERTLKPLYDGSPEIAALKGRLQRGECPLIEIEDEGEIVAASYAAIGDSGRLDAQLALVAVRTEALLERAQAGIRSPMPVGPSRAPATFSRLLALKAGARRLAGRLLAPLRRQAPRRHWTIAFRWDDTPADVRHFDLAAYAALPVDPETFHADPFVLVHEGRHYLFAEAFPYATGKGVIVCAEAVKGEAPGPFRTVLEEPWHLSYPQVFAHQGEIYLMPECSAKGGLDLYRATAFPDRWEKVCTLFEALSLVDATLLEHEGRLWLLAGVSSPGGSDWDELSAWHAPALEGPWTPHALNPIKSDCRGARPGGRPLRLGDRLLRPAQRCERAYGEALVWFEIATLTPDAYEEVELSEWRAAGPGLSGPHTADLSTGLRVLDFRQQLG
jgi:hypothetical protein